MSARRVLYVQFTNPAGYPPLLHSSALVAEHGCEVQFLGIALGKALTLPPNAPKSHRISRITMIVHMFFPLFYQAPLILNCNVDRLYHRINCSTDPAAQANSGEAKIVITTVPIAVRPAVQPSSRARCTFGSPSTMYMITTIFK